MPFYKNVRPSSGANRILAGCRRVAGVLAGGLLLLGGTTLPVSAQEGPDRAGILSLQLENDLWGSGEDRHYTHGTRIAYLSSEDVPDWLYRGARYVPVFSRTGHLRASFAVGQSIFTPRDISSRELIEDDRPYAGWLYCGVGLVSDHRVRDGAVQSNRLDVLELNVGIVGPQAFAGETQAFVHKLIDSARPKGWHHQLQNELGLLLHYDRQWQAQYFFDVGGLGIDLSPHVGGSLGNVNTSLAAGAVFRFGQDLPSDYGPPLIRPSRIGSGFFHPTRKFGWYLFAGVEGRLVLHNIFLDGNTFEPSHRVEPEPWVGDLQVGLVMSFGDVRLSFTNIFRSDEFRGQDASTEFGSISLSLRL